MSWDSRAPQDPRASRGGMNGNHPKRVLSESRRATWLGLRLGLRFPRSATKILKNNAQAPTGRLSGLEKLQSLGPRLQPVQVAHGHRTASPVAVVLPTVHAGLWTPPFN